MDNNQNLNKQLKKLIFIMGLFLFSGIIAISIALVIKKRAKPSEIKVSHDLAQENNNFFKNCPDLITEYKEEYIAINSNKCSRIMIINSNTGRIIYSKY